MFQPYVQSAGQLSAKGIAQGLQMLDPTVGIQSYMNPYRGAVLDEINRQAAIGQKRLSDQAVQSGAFGGSVRVFRPLNKRAAGLVRLVSFFQKDLILL